MRDVVRQDVAVTEASSGADIDDVRTLFIEYQHWLGLDLTFQNFSAELRSLPGDYRPPSGRLLLARQADGALIGGVAMKPLSDGICEMKRLYVRPPWRGAGLGRTLANAIVAAGRTAGYTRMRLDTLARLASAIRLYRSMGFREIDPYCENLLGGAMYMEKALDERGSAAASRG